MKKATPHRSGSPSELIDARIAELREGEKLDEQALEALIRATVALNTSRKA